MTDLDEAVVTLGIALTQIKDLTGAVSLYAVNDSKLMLQVKRGTFNVIARGHEVETTPVSPTSYYSKRSTEIGGVEIYYLFEREPEEQKEPS